MRGMTEEKNAHQIDPKLIVFFVGLIVQLFFGVSGPARASTLRSRGVEPLEKGEPRLTLQ